MAPPIVSPYLFNSVTNLCITLYCILQINLSEYWTTLSSLSLRLDKVEWRCYFHWYISVQHYRPGVPLTCSVCNGYPTHPTYKHLSRAHLHCWWIEYLLLHIWVCLMDLNDFTVIVKIAFCWYKYPQSTKLMSQARGDDNSNRWLKT